MSERLSTFVLVSYRPVNSRYNRQLLKKAKAYSLKPDVPDEYRSLSGYIQFKREICRGQGIGFKCKTVLPSCFDPIVVKIKGGTGGSENFVYEVEAIRDNDVTHTWRIVSNNAWGLFDDEIRQKVPESARQKTETNYTFELESGSSWLKFKDDLGEGYCTLLPHFENSHFARTKQEVLDFFVAIQASLLDANITTDPNELERSLKMFGMSMWYQINAIQTALHPVKAKLTYIKDLSNDEGIKSTFSKDNINFRLEALHLCHKRLIEPVAVQLRENLLAQPSMDPESQQTIKQAIDYLDQIQTVRDIIDSNDDSLDATIRKMCSLSLWGTNKEALKTILMMIGLDQNNLSKIVQFNQEWVAIQKEKSKLIHEEFAGEKAKSHPGFQSFLWRSNPRTLLMMNSQLSKVLVKKEQFDQYFAFGPGKSVQLNSQKLLENPNFNVQRTQKRGRTINSNGISNIYFTRKKLNSSLFYFKDCLYFVEASSDYVYRLSLAPDIVPNSIIALFRPRSGPINPIAENYAVSPEACLYFNNSVNNERHLILVTITPDPDLLKQKPIVRETFSESVEKLISNSIADLDRALTPVSCSIRFASQTVAFLFSVSKCKTDSKTIFCRFAELKIDNNVLAVTQRGSFSLNRDLISSKLEKFRLICAIGRSERRLIMNTGINGKCHVVQLARGKLKILGWFDIRKGIRGEIQMILDWQTGQITVWEKTNKDICCGSKQRVVVGQLKL